MSETSFLRITRRFLSMGVLGLTAISAWAQSVESDPAPKAGAFEPEAGDVPEQQYLVPDVPERLYEKTEVRERWFTLKPGLVLIADYTAFSQDEESRRQVGEQHDQWEARAARAMLRGTIGLEYKVSYLIAAEYKGFETDPEDTWQLTDLSATFPLGSPATRLTLGKTKETFAYEMVGDAANLPHMERILNPFFVSRNVGAKISQVIGVDHRMTAAAGVFNDGWVDGESLSDNGTDVTARVTGLVWDESEGTRFLHVGVSSRYAGGDENKMRYRGRPESNVADNYVDTGTLESDHAWHLGVEGLWNHGPFSVLAEYNRAWVTLDGSGDPTFFGYYLTGSWIVTGETRPYDRTVGYARRVIPERRWGALELVARFSHLDLQDEAVHGGSMDRTYLGVNWWATTRWKFGLGWGHTWLDRFSETGNTDSLLARFQWVY